MDQFWSVRNKVAIPGAPDVVDAMITAGRSGPVAGASQFLGSAGNRLDRMFFQPVERFYKHSEQTVDAIEAHEGKKALKAAGLAQLDYEEEGANLFMAGEATGATKFLGELRAASGALDAFGGTRAGGGGEGQVLYRLITEGEPEANFLSNAAKGIAPRGPEVSNPLIHNGLSMFDTYERAAAKAPILERGGRHVFGIAEVRLPAAAAVTVTKTLGRGHYTVSGAPDAIASFWERSWIW